MKIMYGLEVTDPNHPFLVLGEKQVEMFSRAAMPGTFLCENIPARSSFDTTRHFSGKYSCGLRMIPVPVKYVPSWVPGATFKRQAAFWSRCDKQLRDEPFQIVKGLLVSVHFIFHTITAGLRNDGTRKMGLRPRLSRLPCWKTYTMRTMRLSQETVSVSLTLVRSFWVVDSPSK